MRHDRRAQRTKVRSFRQGFPCPAGIPHAIGRVALTTSCQFLTLACMSMERITTGIDSRWNRSCVVSIPAKRDFRSWRRGIRPRLSSRSRPATTTRGPLGCAAWFVRSRARATQLHAGRRARRLVQYRSRSSWADMLTQFPVQGHHLFSADPGELAQKTSNGLEPGGEMDRR
jgi:hypothetical protein